MWEGKHLYNWKVKSSRVSVPSTLSPILCLEVLGEWNTANTVGGRGAVILCVRRKIPMSSLIYHLCCVYPRRSRDVGGTCFSFWVCGQKTHTNCIGSRPTKVPHNLPHHIYFQYLQKKYTVIMVKTRSLWWKSCALHSLWSVVWALLTQIVEFTNHEVEIFFIANKMSQYLLYQVCRNILDTWLCRSSRGWP